MQEVQRPLITTDEVMRLPAARKDAHGQILEPDHVPDWPLRMVGSP